MTLVFRNHCRERDLNLDTNQQLFDVGILAQSFGDVDPANQDPLGLLHTQSGQMRTWEKEGCLSTKSRGKARFVEKYGALSSSKNETRITIVPSIALGDAPAGLKIPTSEEKVEDAEVAHVTKAEDRKTWTGERTEKRN
jgi:hypothetical protein